jgi:hypothetical protein
VGWKSIPGIEFRFPENTGDLSDAELQITLSISEDPVLLGRLASGIAFPPMQVHAWETVTDSGQTYVFRGVLEDVEINPEEKKGRIRLLCKPHKTLLKTKMGLQCNVTCEWRLFGRGCSIQGVDGPQALVESRLAPVADLEGRGLLTGTYTPIDDPKSFVRGFAQFQGLNIDIVGWDPKEPNVFVMTKPPPDSWIGQTIRIYPGCDGSIETCRDTWDNEENFQGPGYGMPAYRPEAGELG